MSDSLEPLARRAVDRPFFLAQLLNLYSRDRCLDDSQLAEYLGCRPGKLDLLRLCRAPGIDHGFETDLHSLATAFGLNEEKLAEVVRHAQALLVFARGLPGHSGVVLAARDGASKKDPREPIP